MSDMMWVMPVGAEPLGHDGEDMVYVDADGVGSVHGVRVTDVSLAIEEDDTP